jgi:hypothetical protein
LKGIDCSSVPANIYMIRWWGTNGEILYNHADRLPVREKFIDITPYVPLFNQWMSIANSSPPSPSPPIALPQAKTVKIDMLNALFDSKRQAPYHYPVASGDYWWDATDATMFSSLVPAVENLVAKVNEVIAGLNNKFPDLDNVDANAIAWVNANADQSNANGGQGNALRDSVNSRIITEFNNTIAPSDSSAKNAISTAIQTGSIVDYNGIATPLAQPGLTGIVAGIPSFSAAVTAAFNAASGHVARGAGTWAGIASVPSPAASWIPIGSTTPVNVTPAEQQAIIAGITDRTNQLNLITNQKTAAVNALTTVAAVIAYDVLAGWPVIPLPPGYTQRSVELEPQHWAAPAVTAGVPEAPSDGVTYGRRNAIWNPALALTGDVLDGGQF